MIDGSPVAHRDRLYAVTRHGLGIETARLSNETSRPKSNTRSVWARRR
jgi:hypothetical protein